MVALYVKRIRAGKMTLEEVPERWREAVRKALEEQLYLSRAGRRGGIQRIVSTCIQGLQEVPRAHFLLLKKKGDQMNKGTKIRTILAIATCLNTALMATDVAQFHNETVDLIYRILSVVLNFVIVACVTWYNNDYTPEACEGTGLTRLLKRQNNQEDYSGEVFTGEDLEVSDESRNLPSVR